MWHSKNPLVPFLLSGIITVSFLLTGCSKSEPEAASNGGSEKKAKSTYTIGMSQCNLGEPWRVEINAPVKTDADKQPNFQIAFKKAQKENPISGRHVEKHVSGALGPML